MKVSIITRARNRLEYTIRCIDSVARNTRETDYEHIIINQACSDGTREWLDWIAEHGGEWFSRVRAIHSDENFGDWGGMVRGSVEASGDYIVQLDNDVVVPPEWLGTMMDVLDNTGFGTVGLRITGTERIAAESRGQSEEFTRENGSSLELLKHPYVTACWMARAEEFHSVATTRRNCRDACRAIAGGSCQVMNVCATELDSSTTATLRSESLSQTKYPRTSQIWEKL